MSSTKFSDDFKRDAVAQITERGYPVREVAERLGVSQYSPYSWKKKFAKASKKRGAIHSYCGAQTDTFPRRQPGRQFDFEK
ncbi:transposase [Thioclava sp. ES.031]|nr:transposase [Thioclava sp. ES.031]